MHTLVRHLGNLLILAGLLVGTSLWLWTGGVSVPASQPVDPAESAESVESVELSTATPIARPAPPIPAVVRTAPTPEPRLPITRVVIASIGLDTEVVTAPLVENNGKQTWLVPAFRAGQAEDTAGAGQPGNAVLMGHVSSLHSGDVFKNLDRVQVSDRVEVFSAADRFTYRVYETRSVPRTDLAMVEPTSDPIISLFTCTGAWDPVAWDFTKRLFVRARLVSSS